MEGTKNNYNIPNLFIVGAPKCGTTSMHNWLSQHPEIFMSDPKEPLYFCTDHLQETDDYHQKRIHTSKYRDANSYFSLFQEVNKEKYAGESSARYLASRAAPQKIYEHNPQARIIIMLRDPIEFMHSWHSEQIRQSTEDIEDFEKALEMEETRKKYQNMPRTVKCPSDIFYREWTHFSAYIDNYRKYFPPEQIKIILLEEMKQSPQNVYTELLNFLGVEDAGSLPSLETYNTHSTPKNKSLNRFVEHSKYARRMSQILLPARIRHGITGMIKNKNFKKQERSPLNEQTRKRLKKEFRPEVERLAQRTNKDLFTIWNYDQME